MRVDSYQDWLVQQSNNDLAQPSSPPKPSDPPPPDKIDAPEGNDPNAASEGISCEGRACKQGLKCVKVYLASEGSVIGAFCMESCQTQGDDPICDGDEVCAISRTSGSVCFAANNPQEGFTHPQPGENPVDTPPDSNAPPQKPADEGNGLNAQEDKIYQLLNQERLQNGLSTLALDPAGNKAARAHCQDMCNNGYFSHTSLDGRKPWDRMKAAGAQFSGAGENIARGYSSSVNVHQGWINSEGHRNNMLSANWTRVGIGFVDCNGQRFWTQVFMK
jgi:uncharacterized protein YkwD